MSANRASINSCSVELVHWLLENRSERCAQSAIDSAAAVGGLQMMEWLYTNFGGNDRVAIATAVGYGHLEVLEWILQIHLPNGTHNTHGLP